MNDFHTDLPERRTKSKPLRSLDCALRYGVMVSSNLFCFCPRPCDIQFLEVHIRAMFTQSARIGLHTKQCVFSAHSTRDVEQNMLPRLHQIKPLTMNILQVGIARGSSRRSSRTCCPCEEPCLVLKALHTRNPGAIYEVLPERGVNIVGPILRLQPYPHRRVGIVAVSRLAALVRKVHAVPHAGPVVIIALRVDSRPLHTAIATSIPIPVVIVPGGRARRQEQICPGFLPFGGGSRAIPHIQAADEA